MACVCSTGVWGCIMTLATKFPIPNEEMDKSGE